MPTKTNTVANKTRLESANVRQTVTVKNNWTGTAIELLRALEETDTEIEDISVSEDMGKPKVTVWTGDEKDGAATGVPEPLHRQLLDYDYYHVGEDGNASYSHTDEVSSHVYIKD